jgi:hypothetical protein
MHGRHFFNIPAGNYSAEDIVNKILYQIYMVGKLLENNITYNENTHKLTFLQKPKYALAVYSEHSILYLLDLSKHTSLIQSKSLPKVEYIILEPNKKVISELPAHMNTLTSIFVYSGIIELSLVGDF